jgi:Secretion system C-terminal sorting domain
MKQIGMMICIMLLSNALLNSQTFSRVYRNTSGGCNTGSYFSDWAIEDSTYYFGGQKSYYCSYTQQKGWLMRSNFGNIPSIDTIIEPNSAAYGMRGIDFYGRDSLIGLFYDNVNSYIFLSTFDKNGNGFVWDTIHGQRYTFPNNFAYDGRSFWSASVDLSGSQLGRVIKFNRHGIILKQIIFSDITEFYNFIPQVVKVDTDGSPIVQINKFHGLIDDYLPDYEEKINLVKIDSSNGRLLWSYTSPSTKFLTGGALLPVSDGYLIGGSRAYRNVTLRRVDQKGYIAKLKLDSTLLWEREYGTNGQTRLNNIVNLNDGTYILSGKVNDTTSNNIQLVGWVLKIDSLGNIIWERKIKHFYGQNFSRLHVLGDMHIDNQGYYNFRGNIIDALPSSPSFGHYGWLVRTDSFGCLVPGCQLLDNVQEPDDGSISLKVFPNPTDGLVYVHFHAPLQQLSSLRLRIVNALGQEMRSWTEGFHDMQYVIEMGGYPAGLYYLVVENEKGELLKAEKIIIQR